MSIIKLILLIGYIFQLCISKNIERIEFINKLEIPCLIKQRQTYEITFNSLEIFLIMSKCLFLQLIISDKLFLFLQRMINV